MPAGALPPQGERMQTTTLTTLASATLFTLCLAGAAGCGDDTSDDRDDRPVPAALRADLQALIDADVAQQRAPGVLLDVAIGGGPPWSTAAGVADVQQRTAMTPDVHFRAGSVLKTFVATAALQQVEAGRLGLDDVLTDHLPAAITARIPGADRITVRMLLAHRAGIPDWVTAQVVQAIVADPGHVWSLDEILTSATSQPTPFPPGEGYAYSNTHYVLLGEIITRVAGRSWRAVVREQVIARAGLTATSLPEPGDHACPAPCAHGYVPVAGDLLDTSGVDPSMAGASGGHALITRTADLTRFFQRLRAGALFDRAGTLDLMFTFQSAPDPTIRLARYGLGVMELDATAGHAIGHLGITAGYQSFMFYIPATDRYVTGSINVMGDIGAVLGPIVARLSQP